MATEYVEWVELHVICATVPAEIDNTRFRPVNTTRQSKPLRTCYTETGIVDFYKSGFQTASVEEIKEYTQPTKFAELPETESHTNTLYGTSNSVYTVTTPSSPIPIPVTAPSGEFRISVPKLEVPFISDHFSPTYQSSLRKQQSNKKETRGRGKHTECEESFQGRLSKSPYETLDASKETSKKEGCTCDEYTKCSNTTRFEVCPHCCKITNPDQLSGSECEDRSPGKDIEYQFSGKTSSGSSGVSKRDSDGRVSPMGCEERKPDTYLFRRSKEEEDLLPRTCHQPDYEIETEKRDTFRSSNIWDASHPTEDESWGELFDKCTPEGGAVYSDCEIMEEVLSEDKRTPNKEGNRDDEKAFFEETSGDYILYSPFGESGSDGITLPISQDNGPDIRNQTYPDPEWPPRLFTDEQKSTINSDGQVGIGLRSIWNGLDNEGIRKSEQIYENNERDTEKEFQSRSEGGDRTGIQSTEGKDINRNSDTSQNEDRLSFISEDSLAYLQLSSCYRTTCFTCNKSWFPPCDGCYQRDKDLIQTLQDCWSSTSRGAYETWSNNRLGNSIRAHQSEVKPQSTPCHTNQGEGLSKLSGTRDQDQAYSRLVDHIIGSKNDQGQGSCEKICQQTDCGSKYNSGRSPAPWEEGGDQCIETDEDSRIYEGNRNDKSQNTGLSITENVNSGSISLSESKLGDWASDRDASTYCGFEKGFLFSQSNKQPKNSGISSRSILQPEKNKDSESSTTSTITNRSSIHSSDGFDDRSKILGKTKKTDATEETGRRIRQFYQEISARNETALHNGSKPYVTRIIKAIEKFPIPDKPGVYGERTTYFDNDGEFIDFIVGKIYIHMYIYET